MRRPAAELRPVLLAFVAAAFWGLWWIPVRWLEAQGVPGAMAGVTINAGATVAALAWCAVRGQSLRIPLRGLIGATLVGLAVSSYSVALAEGQVVRVVLLFYLAPAWSKLIEWAFLRMRWGWSSTLALVAALSGAVLVLGGDVSLTRFGVSDLLAVMSGMAWAGGAALIFLAPGPGAAPMAAVTAMSAAVIGFAYALAVGSVGPLPVAALGGALAGVVYALPILALTLWSASRLTPAVLTFLLTAEILSGIISGALFLDEPFTPMMALGATLIVLGALAELAPALGVRRRGSGGTA
ncbi:DMT family transporter [Lutimaribacter marinistellae]|uniref:DMT family transporter n=1 Tax=Lutimaribacter marinistellae TaxID=1820329 RepID=A0ABV7THV5_9RHOB